MTCSACPSTSAIVAWTRSSSSLALGPGDGATRPPSRTASPAARRSCELGHAQQRGRRRPRASRSPSSSPTAPREVARAATGRAVNCTACVTSWKTTQCEQLGLVGLERAAPPRAGWAPTSSSRGGALGIEQRQLVLAEHAAAHEPDERRRPRAPIERAADRSQRAGGSLAQALERAARACRASTRGSRRDPLRRARRPRAAAARPPARGRCTRDDALGARARPSRRGRPAPRSGARPRRRRRRPRSRDALGELPVDHQSDRAARPARPARGVRAATTGERGSRSQRRAERSSRPGTRRRRRSRARSAARRRRRRRGSAPQRGHPVDAGRRDLAHRDRDRPDRAQARWHARAAPSLAAASQCGVGRLDRDDLEAAVARAALGRRRRRAARR